MKVIVTGASRGIGRGIASVLAGEGHELGLLARSQALLSEVQAGIQAEGGQCQAAVCDLGDWNGAETAINRLVDQMGGVDVLINNAGLVIRKSVTDISLDEWRSMVDANVHGVFHAVRAVLPHFTAQNRGHIINVSSIAGRVPLPGGSGYAATKYAVTGFSQSIFQELRAFGIRVTTLYPGSVDSASHRHAADADTTWKVTPEEVGQACADILRYAPGTVISEVEIRPLRRPPPA